MVQGQARKTATRALSAATQAALVGLVLSATVTPAAAQIPKNVRVVRQTGIVRWFPNVASDVLDVLATVAPGTELDTLDEYQGWYWVMAPPDAHGTNRSGWIAVGAVEPFVRVVSSSATTPGRLTIVDTVPRPSPEASPTTSAAVPPAPFVETTITTTTKDVATVRTTREYNFEDIHFDFDRSSIRQSETRLLDDAANQLKNDPLLRLNLEGYTCSVGPSAYNLALGDRRARAVKEYLVSKGVSGDRLSTASLGETKPKHDNSRRETRALNRRVALVPAPQP